MPSCAAPKATKVATSKERTRMMSRSAMVGGEAQLARVGIGEGRLRARCRRARAAAPLPRGCGPWAAPGSASRWLRSTRPLAPVTNARPSSNPASGYSTGWAGFHGVGQGSPTSPKWHASRPISSRMARPAANRSVTERSSSWRHRQQFEHPVGLARSGMSRWRTAVTSLKTRAEWVRRIGRPRRVGSASQRKRFTSRTKRFSSSK